MRSFLLVLVIAGLLRLVLAVRQDLWADELFSLALATGHSLEQPAALADSTAGDFIEPAGPVAPTVFRRYLAHDTPPAGPARVVRAVRLSDTSPPLYYLVLDCWTRLLGTSDLALRGLSVAWALATLPLMWLIGRRVAGTRAALSACVLFGLAPTSLYYAVEVRMYALLWFETALTAWLTLRLHDHGGTGTLLAWIITAAAGLMTHYFFVFVWTACVLWLLLRPGQSPRRYLAAAVGLTLVLIAPWYRLVPETLGGWRVTGQWLDGRPALGRLLLTPLTLAWSLVVGRGVVVRSVWADCLVALVVLALGIHWLRRGRAALFAPGRDLLWLVAVAACVGPGAFDLLRDSSTSLIVRYAIAGLPAVLLLLALALSELAASSAVVATTLLVLGWLPAYGYLARPHSRGWEPYRAVAAEAATWADAGGLVLVHSIPSGVLGVARYLPADVPMAAWVGELGRRRIPADIEALTTGRARVAFIRIHEAEEPAPEQDWLRAHATLRRERALEGAHILYFELDPSAH